MYKGEKMKNTKLLVAVLSISFLINSQSAQAAEDETLQSSISEAAQSDANNPGNQDQTSISKQKENNPLDESTDESNIDSIKNKQGETQEEKNQGKSSDQIGETKPKGQAEANTIQENPVEKASDEKDRETDVKGKNITVKVDESVSPSDVLENLPADADAEFVGSVDTSSPGTINARVKVTFASGEINEIEVTITVEAEENDINKSEDQKEILDDSGNQVPNFVGEPDAERETYRQRFEISI